MATIFPEVKKNFGFGCMRLPMTGNGDEAHVDTAEVTRMVDAFIQAGFNYFDTAHVYLRGQSETALKTCLTSRYPRDAYLLADKLSGSCFETEADIRPYFESMLSACGVEYFDFFLMHAQGSQNYEKYTRCRAYEIGAELRREGKIRHLGMSFHDSAQVLDMILSQHPEIEFVQLQFNYLDYDDPGVQSGACLEVCKRYGKPVVVMEPVKGGALVNLPASAAAPLGNLENCSPAGLAIRYAAGFDGIFMVLSGMSSLDQMTDNLSVMKSYMPLSDKESAIIREVVDLFRKIPLVPCTACRYCEDGCPVKLKIPTLIAALNRARQYGADNARWPYDRALREGGNPADCLKCGKCEKICPQHLPIRDCMTEVVDTFQ